MYSKLFLNQFRRLLIKPTKWHVSHRRLRSAWAFAVRMKKAWVLNYPVSTQQWLWLDWVDAQADQSLRWAHMPLCWFCHIETHFRTHLIWQLSCLIFQNTGLNILQTISIAKPDEHWKIKNKVMPRVYRNFLKSNWLTCFFSRQYFVHCDMIRTASSEFSTYHLCEQQRFRRACASAQSRQNLRCSLIQAVSQEEPSNRKPDPWPLWMAGHAQLKFVMTECSKTQIRLTGLLLCNLHHATHSKIKWKPENALKVNWVFKIMTSFWQIICCKMWPTNFTYLKHLC